MKEVKVFRSGEFRENRWTRLNIVWRAARGFYYEVERFEPLARGAETFLRAQVPYFARLDCRVVSLETTQTERFDGHCLMKPNPTRHWQPDGFSLVARFPRGTGDPEALIALLREPVSE